MGASDAEAIVVRSLALSQLGRIDEALASIEAVDVEDFPFGQSARALVRALAGDRRGRARDAEAVERAAGASYFDRSVACLGGVVAALRRRRRGSPPALVRPAADDRHERRRHGVPRPHPRPWHAKPANVPESLGEGWKRIVEQATATADPLRLTDQLESGISSPKLTPSSRAVSIESQSSGTDFIRWVASDSGT